MQGNKDVLKKHCGLPISTYFSALKLRWLIDNVTEVREAIEEDRCLFGTVDTWLIWVINLSLNELIFIELSVINLTESDRRGQWWAPSNGCDQRFTNDAYEPWNVELGSVPLQVISPNLQLLPSLYLHFFLIREKLSRIGINYSYKLKIFFCIWTQVFWYTNFNFAGNSQFVGDLRLSDVGAFNRNSNFRGMVSSKFKWQWSLFSFVFLTIGSVWEISRLLWLVNSVSNLVALKWHMELVDFYSITQVYRLKKILQYTSL